MSGALVAAVGLATGPTALTARLERLRLNPNQQSAVESHPGLCIGVLSHPVLAEPEPFRPFARTGDGRFLGLLHGRVDNLDELGAGGPGAGASEWALAQWLRGGAPALGAMAGSFVVVIADLGERRLHLIRDPLGDASACYAAADGAWWAATEEPALWPEQGPLALNPRTVAEFFAVEFPAAGSTFFAGITELPPAHAVALAPARAPQLERYWEFRYRPEVRALALEEAAEGLRDRLSRAVEARCDATAPTAIAVSGGMDSTALAALAPARAGARLYTYQTPAFPACDETQYAAELASRLGAPLTAVRCDRHWPLSQRFFDPSWLPHAPFADAYRALRFDVARAAAGDDCRVLLTGDFGDHLYTPRHYWLKDLFTTGQWARGLRHFGRRLVRHGLLGLRRDPPLRRLLPLIGITRGRRRRRGWLSAEANRLLGPGAREHAYLGPIAEVDRVEGCIDNYQARLAHLGHLQGLRWGVELRTPFRDRRLVEFALSLPAHYLYDPERDETKALLRRALREQLPPVIVARRGKTSLEALFRHGVLGVGRATVEDLLAEDVHWRRFVRADWLSTRLLRDQWDDRSLFVLWSAVAFALWCRRLGREVTI